MIKLSQNQLAVVEAPIGDAMQVLASAGSGKTRVLTERIRYILGHTKKDGVIALTFTNKAAEEMASRLEDVEDLADRCWIATVHSVAQRVLDQYGYTIGLPSELHIFERDQDRQAVFLESLRRNTIDVNSLLSISPLAGRRERDTAIRNCMDRFSQLKRQLITSPPESAEENDQDFWFVFEAYQDALLESGGIDFDDILVYAHRILLEQPWCADVYRAKYKHVCVDEAQDLNRAQYEFIKALCGQTLHSVLMVGDPNQMIYGFNGSSSDYLCKQFPSDFSATSYSLSENYRSSQAVIDAAQRLAVGQQLQAVYPIRGRVEVQTAEDETAEARWIGEQIESLLRLEQHDEIEGPITPDKIVAIARNRYVFEALQAELQRRAIPFALNRGEGQVEPSSVFGRVLDLAIRLRINPKDWLHGRRLCKLLGVKPAQEWGDDALLGRLAEVMDESTPYSPVQRELLKAVQELALESPKIPKLCSEFEVMLTQAAKVSEEGDGELERSLQELKTFRDCWVSFRRKGLGDSLQAFRNSMALGQLLPDSASGAVTLSTVHTMKGLEKDIVFMMAMCEGVFPDYRARTAKAIAEEQNSAFVAVTRARRWLYVTYPQRRTMPWGDVKRQEPSRFLLAIQQA